MPARGYPHAVALLLAVGLLGCHPTPSPPPPPPPGLSGTHPECPTHQISLPYAEHGTTLTATAIGKSPNIATIPEFNDCQRLIEGHAFGPLVAIFAAEGLENAAYLSDVTRTQGRVVATVYSFDDEFKSLHISKEFNCLYFFRSASPSELYVARMAPNVGPECPDMVPASAVGGALRVVAKPGQYGPSEVPAVARWDWNGETQSIGIKCGSTWCEVGPGSGWAPGLGKAAPAGTAPALAKMFQIKGSYDQQLLAPPTGKDWDHKGTPGPQDWTHPSGILGTIVPSPGVGEFVATDFAGRWTTVAMTYLEGEPAGAYRDKYGFASTPSDRGNDVQLCDPTLTACPGLPTDIDGTQGCKEAMTTIASENVAGGHASRWYAKVTPADGGEQVSLCVIRRAHLGFTGHMPSTARWRWLLDDDSIWIPCVFACCQVKGH